MLLDKITQIVQDYADDAIVKNPSVPNEKNNKAIKATAASLTKQLTSKSALGNKDSLLDLFNNDKDLGSNPAVSRISSGVAGDLVKKLGINNAAASDIVSKIVPVILAKIKNRTNDPNDKDWNLDEIIGSFGKGSGLLNIVKGLFGK